MKKTKPSMRAVCLLLVLYTSMHAQVAQLSGRVADPSGASVPMTSIVAVNVNTGVRRAVESNEEGYYAVPSMPAGTYRVTAQREGFKPISRENIVFQADSRVRIDFVLELGTISEILTVTDAPPLVEQDSAESGRSITTREYEKMPLIQVGRIRNPTSFIYMVPGTHGNVNTNGSEYTGATNRIQINGSQIYTTEILVDGMVAGQSVQVGNFTESAPPVDAVQEFKVQSSQMSAEYGHSGAAVINFTLRSGTNQLHGSAFNYLRNDKLDARNWMASSRAITRQNEFGATLGGPLYIPRVYDGKDRTFFFYTYSGSRKRGVDTVSRTQVPTPEMLQGDFSQNVDASGRVVPIYDPATTRSNGGSGFLRDPFPGNVIPKNRFDSVAANVIPYYPEPNLTGAGSLNYSALSGEAKLDPNVYTTKIDHAFSSTQRLTGTLNVSSIPRLRIDKALPEPIGSTAVQSIKSQMARLSYLSVISPSLLNEFSVGYNRFRNEFVNSTQGGGWPQTLGLAGVPGSSFPAFNFSNGYTGLSSTYLVDNIDQTYILKDAMTRSTGRHVTKFGFEMRRIQPNNRTLSNTNGTFNFDNKLTGNPSNLNNTGNGFASFLLGNVQSASLSLPGAVGLRRPYWGFYAQDDFKVTPQLTLNLGLRFEVEEMPYEAADRYSTIDLGTPNPGAGNLLGALLFAGTGEGRIGNRSLGNTSFSGVGPRFGFAYRLAKHTVLRGGYGIYYASNQVNVSTAGFNLGASFQSLDNGITRAFQLSDGFPQGFRQTPSIDPTFQNGQGGGVLEPTSGVMPRTQNWSFGIQHELSANLMVEAKYIGNHNTRQFAAELVNINQVDSAYLSLGSLLTANIHSAAARQANIPIPYEGFNGSVAQALRPYPQFQTLSTPAKAGRSKYHALELAVRKRLSFGLSTNVQYTFSRNIGYTVSALGGVDSNVGMDQYNRQLDHGILQTDIPHALLLDYVYDLPFGPGRRFLKQKSWLSALAGGWSVGGVHRYQSGTPIALSMNNSLPLFNRAMRPNRVAGVDPATRIGVGDFQPGSNRVINIAAFASPGPFQFGNSSPNLSSLRNFAVYNEDLSIVKTTSLRERITLENYFQFLNVANRHRFTGIVGNFSAANFGQVTGASQPRYIQVGVRVRF